MPTIDLPDLRARLRVDLSELRRAPAQVRETIRRIQAEASRDPVTIHVDTDARRALGEVDRERRRTQHEADRHPVEVPTKVDLRQFLTFAQRIRDVRTIASATTGPIQDFSTKVAKLAVVAGAGSTALVGAAGLSGGLLAVAAAASQAAGALPLLAPALATYATVAITARIASLGVADAIEDKLAPITEHLSANAQALVDRFGDLVPALTRAKNAIQNAGFRGLADVVRPLAERYLPLLQRTAVGLAQTFNTDLRSAIRSLMTAGARLQLGEVLGAASGAAQELAPRLARIPRVLLGITAAAAPAFRELSEVAGEALDAILRRLQRGLDTGTLAAGIERGVQALQNLAGAAVAVGSVIRSVVHAASAVFGGNLLRSIDLAASRLAAFFRTPEGAATLKAFFAATLPVLHGIGQLATVLGPELAELAPTILALADAFLRGLRPVIPVAGELLRTLGGTLAQILPAVSAVAVAVGQALTGALKILAPVLPPILAGLQGLLSPTGLLTAALQALAPVLPTLAGGLAQVVGILAGAFVEALNAIAPMLPPLAEAVADLAVAVATGLSSAITALAPQLPAIVTGLTDFLIAVTPLIPVVADFAAKVAPLSAQLLPPLAQILTALAPLVILLAQGLSALLVPAIGAANTVTLLFLRPLASLASGITTATGLIPLIVVALQQFAGTLSDTVTSALQTFADAGKRAWNAVRNAALTGISLILGGIDLFLGGLQNMLEAVGNMPGPFGGPFRRAAEAVGRVRGRVGDLQTSIDNLRGKAVDVTVRMRGVDVTGSYSYSSPGTRFVARALGGWIGGPWRGPTADNMLIRANPKEFVVSAPAAIRLERLLPGFLDALNRGLLPIGGDPSGAWIGRRLPRLAGGGSVPYVQSKIRQTDPWDYVLGGTGPPSGGIDCSGLMGYAYALTKGLAPFVRYFTTASFPGFDGFRRGTARGAFNVGVNPGTHMAGNYAGLPFEAQSTATGIHVGAGVTPVSAFAQQWHLPLLAGLTLAQIHRVIGDVRPLVLADMFRELGFRRADDGAWLPPRSTTVVANTTGQWEPVGPPGAGPMRWHEDDLNRLAVLIGREVARRPVVLDGKPVASYVDRSLGYSASILGRP
jgi:phage-related protein